jgi:hypothetical protein
VEGLEQVRMQRLDIVSGVSMHHMAISSSNCAKQEADALVFWLEL